MDNHFKSGDIAELQVELAEGVPRGAMVRCLTLIPAGTPIIKNGTLSFWEYDGWQAKWGDKEYGIYEHLLRHASRAIKKNRGARS